MYRKLVRWIIYVVLISLFGACQKAREPKRYVNYYVSLKSGNTVSIYCSNDYYFDSGGNSKEIIFKADLDYFSSTRLANKNEPYFMVIKPKDLIEDTVNITAIVSINDSIVNYKISKTLKEDIVLFGNVN